MHLNFWKKTPSKLLKKFERKLGFYARNEEENSLKFVGLNKLYVR